MSKKRRTGGNPCARQAAGRVTRPAQPPCKRRSSVEGRPVPCKRTSRLRVAGGPWVAHCSWCGSIEPGQARPPTARGPDPEPVPADRFSAEAPAIALPIAARQRAHRLGVAGWPQEAVAAYAEELQSQSTAR